MILSLCVLLGSATALPLSSAALAVSVPSLPATGSSLPLLSRSQERLPAIVEDWNPFDEDETCTVVEEASVEHILEEPPLTRALEIAGILLSKVVLPLSSSIIMQGSVEDWDEFWERPNNGETNGERLTHALEELGPVYVKFGQALSSRADAIPRSLANSLSKLQDCMQPFDADSAKRIVTQELLESNKLSHDDMQDLLACLAEAPIATASVGQVYKARIGSKTVAVKVQRPGIRNVMERDLALLRTLANWVESIPAPDFIQKQHEHKLVGNRLIAAELEDSVEEFFSRIFEELDYRNEAANAKKFAQLYSNRGGTTEHANVIVPEIYPDLCTDNVLVMEWLDGTKLTSIDEDDPSSMAENLAVIKQAIDCTLSQLLDTGVLHADPHGGNLLKIQTPEGPQLGYLDFGLLATVPQQVRDALVCAVSHLVFDHDSEAVAMLFAELQIVPADVIEDPQERKALTEALNQTMNEVLVYPESVPGTIEFPDLQFDKLINSLTRLVPRFRFQLPPYFMQKARAIGILEGMARSLDSDFNILQMLYPYALQRLMVNPTDSAVMDDTLQNLIRSRETGRVELAKISKLLDDSAHLTGYKKQKVIRDVLKTPGGRRLARKIVQEQVRDTSGHLKKRLMRRIRRKQESLI